MTIRAGVFVSKKKDPFAMGEEAARGALDKLGTKADALIVLGSPTLEHQKVLDGITSVCKDTPMVGGTTGGEISTEGASGESVVVMALCSDSVQFFSGIGTNITKNEVLAGETLTKPLLEKGKKGRTQTLIIFPDGLAGDGAKIVAGCLRVGGEDFEVVGGALGDGADFKKTYQYYDGTVYEDSVPGLLLSGTFVSSSGIRSGYVPMGKQMVVTKSKNNIVYEFDNTPALDYYKKVLGPKLSKKLPGVGLEYPIGVMDETANIGSEDMYFQLRSPLAVSKKDKSITFAASIQEGSKVTITSASQNNVISGAESAAIQAKAGMDDTKPSALFLFDCIGRKLVLGTDHNEEVEAVQRIFGKDIPLIGFFTYGEIGPINKFRGELRRTRWHNETAIIFAIG